MPFWNDFLHGNLPYQDYWLPLIIGVVAGGFCILIGNFIGRGRRKAVAMPLATAQTLDPFIHGSQTEQRRSLRRAGNLVEILYARPDNRKVTKRALVLDRSMGGLRLAAEEEIAGDTILMVLPVNASEQVPWIEIVVRTCRPVEDSFELGCQFVKTPQWSILLLFG